MLSIEIITCFFFHYIFKDFCHLLVTKIYLNGTFGVAVFSSLLKKICFPKKFDILKNILKTIEVSVIFKIFVTLLMLVQCKNFIELQCNDKFVISLLPL